MSAAEAHKRAEVWLGEKDPGIRMIAAEMAEYAGRANVLWAQALDSVATDPDRALARLIDLEILLESLMQLEIDDILKVVREGSERLAGELPDHSDDPADDAFPQDVNARAGTMEHRS